MSHKSHKLHLRYTLTLFALFVVLGLRAQEPDSVIQKVDSLSAREAFLQDSILARQAFVRDSILARETFVRDSILAREQFVRDSLLRRQKILDSLNILRPQLQRLLEAYNKSVRDEIILKCNEIQLVGDSLLGDFIVHTLPFGVKDPYCPWRIKTSLNRKPIRISYDPESKKITSIHTSQFKASFYSSPDHKLMVIHHPVAIQKNSRGNFYKIPVDSVFYDNLRRIAKIKSYVIFHNLINENTKGQFLFTNATIVKQYTYDQVGTPVALQLVRFCERWKSYETNKICSIINYSISRSDNTITLVRRNDPVNAYSDGTYTFTLTENDDPASVSFLNSAKTEGWERTIELNKDGNVSCYIDKSKGLIIQSLCMVYHPEPSAKYPVEIITTTFEKDGISYLQKNNTTGKSRTRNRMTLEWSDWR